MATEELGASAFRKFDIEAWMPSRREEGEISSVSNCTDYQALRLNIKYRTGRGNETDLVHTLNGTACAVPRLLLLLLERGYHSDCMIEVPNLLKAYGATDILRP